VSKGGLSAARLARMHDVLAGYVERGELPGFVTLVSRRGEVHVDAIGYERDAIFRISSMSKPVTAAAAMVLLEEGVIRLDEPVDDFLPELANRKVLRQIDSEVDDTVPARRPIMVRDLLTFTLGAGLIFATPGTYTPSKEPDSGTARRIHPDNPNLTTGYGGSPACRCSTSQATAGCTTPAPRC